MRPKQVPPHQVDKAGTDVDGVGHDYLLSRSARSVSVFSSHRCVYASLKPFLGRNPASSTRPVSARHADTRQHSIITLVSTSTAPRCRAMMPHSAKGASTP